MGGGEGARVRGCGTEGGVVGGERERGKNFRRGLAILGALDVRSSDLEGSGFSIVDAAVGAESVWASCLEM